MASTTILETILKFDQPDRPIFKIETSEEKEAVEIGIDDIFNSSDQEDNPDLDNQDSSKNFTHVSKLTSLPIKNEETVDGTEPLNKKSNQDALKQGYSSRNKNPNYGENQLSYTNNLEHVHKFEQGQQFVKTENLKEEDDIDIKVHNIFDSSYYGENLPDLGNQEAEYMEILPLDKVRNFLNDLNETEVGDTKKKLNKANNWGTLERVEIGVDDIFDSLDEKDIPDLDKQDSSKNIAHVTKATSLPKKIQETGLEYVKDEESLNKKSNQGALKQGDSSRNKNPSYYEKQLTSTNNLKNVDKFEQGQPVFKTENPKEENAIEIKVHNIFNSRYEKNIEDNISHLDNQEVEDREIVPLHKVRNLPKGISETEVADTKKQLNKENNLNALEHGGLVQSDSGEDHVFNEAENSETVLNFNENLDKTHKRKKDRNGTKEINWAAAYRTSKYRDDPLVLEKLKKVTMIAAPETAAVFPSDNERRKIWLSLLGLDENQRLPKFPTLCFEHFDASNIIMKANGSRCIKPDANPQPCHSAFQFVSDSSDSTLCDSPTKRSRTEDICSEELVALPVNISPPTESIEPHEFTKLTPDEVICNHCQHIFRTIKDLNRHIRRMHRDVTKMYQCPYCPQKTKGHIKRHIILKHTNTKDIKWFQCHTCDRKFKEKQSLTEHILFTHLDRMNQCTMCSKSFITPRGVNAHIKHVHKKPHERLPAGKKHIKGEVHNVFNKAENLKRGEQSEDVSKNADKTHKRKKGCDDTSKINWAVAYRTNEVDYGPLVMEKLKEVITIAAPATVAVIEPHEFTKSGPNEYICNHCQRIIKTRYGITRHIQNLHRDVTNMYQCPYCLQKNKIKARIKQHIILKHTNNEKDINWFECHTCGKKFIQKQSLTRHIFTHLDRAQHEYYMKQCTICSKSFTRSRTLISHIKFVHNKEPRKRKRYQCQQCEYRSWDGLAVKKHIEVWHTTPDQRRTHECEQCGYKTTFEFKLRQHNKTHKYCCKKCAFVTTSAGRLKLHQVRHQTTQDDINFRHRCDKCGYKTYKLRCFNVHKLKHLKPNGMDYFYCYHCDYKGKQKGGLKIHILKHFKKEEVVFQCFKCDFSTKKRKLLSKHLERKHSKAQTQTKEC